MEQQPSENQSITTLAEVAHPSNEIKTFLPVGVIALLLLGICLRADLQLLPMNDEIIYTVAAYQTFHKVGSFEINSEHPPIAKIFLGLPCLVKNCSSTWFSLLEKYSVLSLPVKPFADALKNIMPAIRVIPLIFSLLLVTLLYYYADKHFGKEAGITALFFGLFSPNLLLYSNAVMLDMISLFFVSACIFFYVFNYAKQRTLRNLIVLGGLAILAFGTRQYTPFLLIPAIAAAEVWDYLNLKTIDRRLWVGLGSAIILFFFAVYPISTFYHHFADFYKPTQKTGFTLNVLTSFLTRADLLLFLLVPLSAYHLRDAPAEVKRLGAISLTYFAVMFLFPAGLDNFRYGISIFPPLFLFASYSAIKISEKEKMVAGCVAAVFLVTVILQYPYYDNYTNPLGGFLSHAPVEREQSLGTLQFLHKNYREKNVVTTDPYGLPFYSKLNITSVNHWASVKLKSIPDACQNEGSMLKLLQVSGASVLAYRRNVQIYAEQCPALTTATKKLKEVYSDSYYALYSIE